MPLHCCSQECASLPFVLWTNWGENTIQAAIIHALEVFLKSCPSLDSNQSGQLWKYPQFFFVFLGFFLSKCKLNRHLKYRNRRNSAVSPGGSSEEKKSCWIESTRRGWNVSQSPERNFKRKLKLNQIPVLKVVWGRGGCKEVEDLRAERFGSVSHSGSTERTGGVSWKEGGECGWNESSVVWHCTPLERLLVCKPWQKIRVSSQQSEVCEETHGRDREP